MRRFVFLTLTTVLLSASLPVFAQGQKSRDCSEQWFPRWCERWSERQSKNIPNDDGVNANFSNRTMLNTYRSIETVTENEVCKGGYARLRLELAEGNNTDLSVTRVASFGERSFTDWLKNAFVSTEGTYLLAARVFGDVDPSDGYEEGIISYQPIFSYSTKESMRRAVTGAHFDLRQTALAFPVSCDEGTGEFDVQVALFRSKTNDVSTENLRQLLTSAADLAAIAGGGSSLVDATVLSAANGALKKIDDLMLGNFEIVNSLSVREALSLQENGTQSVEYDLLAPNVSAGRFKVHLSVTFQQSLLLSDSEGASNRAGDILQKPIYFDNGEYKSLEEYVRSHPGSRDDWEKLSDPSAALLPICEEIRSALAPRLRQLDRVAAMNALAVYNLSKFRERWDIDCLGAEAIDLAFLEESGVTLLNEPRVRQTELLPQNLATLREIVDALSAVIKSQPNDPTVIDVWERNFNRISNQSSQIDFHDKSGIFFAFSSASIKLPPSALVKLFAPTDPIDYPTHNVTGQAVRFGIGCYAQNNIAEPDVDLQNQVGSLLVANGKALELLWYFDERPPNNKTPVLTRLVVRELTKDRATRYSEGRADRGCGDFGFRPWAYLEEELASSG